MELNIKIEQINHSHIAALQQIGRQTFSETFAESNTAENMAKYLVVGGGGFIGGHLIRRLLDEKNELMNFLSYEEFIG